VEIWDEYNQRPEVGFLGMPGRVGTGCSTRRTASGPVLPAQPAHASLSRDTGAFYSRTRFAEMFLDTSGGMVTYSSPVGGNYFGLYTVEEKIKRGPNRVDIGRVLKPQAIPPRPLPAVT